MRNTHQYRNKSVIVNVRKKVKRQARKKNKNEYGENKHSK